MRRTIPFYFGFATLFTVAAPAVRAGGGAALSSAPAAREARLFEEARAARQQVLAGDLAALDRAQAGLERAVEAAPRDPLPLAYLSGLLAIGAWHAASPPQADALAGRAIALADVALALEAPATGRAAPDGEVTSAAALAYLTVARLVFLRAQGGDAAAIARADALFTRSAALSPDDPLPLAYRGAVLALRLGSEPSDAERGGLIRRSLALLDVALAMAGTPGAGAGREASSAEARLVAAGVFIALPDAAVHTFARGRSLLDAELESPALDRLPPRLRGHIHYQASLAARRQGRSTEEVFHLRAYAATAPADDPLAPTVRARLAEVGR